MVNKMESYYFKGAFIAGNRVVLNKTIYAETVAFREKNRQSICVRKGTRGIVASCYYSCNSGSLQSSLNSCTVQFADYTLSCIPEYILDKDGE